MTDAGYSDEIVEAARLAIIEVTGWGRDRTDTRAVLDVVVPMLREQIAQEIEALGGGLEKSGTPNYWVGYKDAARIVRGQ